MKSYRSFFIAIITFILVISSTSTAFASKDSSLRISSKEMRYSNDYINVNIKIPIASYSKNLDIEKKINKSLEGDIVSFKNQIESSAKKSFEESKKDNFEFIPHEAFENFKVTFKNNKILSIPVIYYTYCGGAHGSTLQAGYNFNLETGDKVILKDLFKANSNFKEPLINAISLGIKEDPSIYFDFALNTVKNIPDNQSFYLTDNFLVVYYGQYDIAPYSSGIREFEIPLSSLSDILNPDYNLIKK